MKSHESLERPKVAKVSIVVPVFNEQDSVRSFLERVCGVFEELNDASLEFIFVNDGSTDKTLDCLLTCQTVRHDLKVLDLTRNFGKEAALTAGFCAATGDVVVPMDVDLQDPPDLIPKMLEKWREGYEVVLAKRTSRSSDSLVKRASAALFYRMHNKMAHPKIPEDVGDFRLMDRIVIEALKLLPESRRFMKGLFSWVGFRTTYVSYARPKRLAGKTKFNGWRLWNFALEGFTSFSTAPLRVWTYLGSGVAVASFLFALFIVTRALVAGVDVPGYASLIVAVTLLGGLQLMGIGILGEYLGRTYIESKRRPVYLIRRVYESGKQ